MPKTPEAKLFLELHIIRLINDLVLLVDAVELS